MKKYDKRGKLSKKYRRHRRRVLKYGITPAELKARRQEQHNSCAICQGSFQDHRMCIDHDHETDEVRGLLCSQCNAALGGFQDDIRLLAAAIVYLQER
jgi:Autographiviridae endonuclease VII